jgi:thiol-disulfide isomerase/thioredoxin
MTRRATRLAFYAFLCFLWGCSNGSDAPSLAAARGHWVVVNYWAEWCKPCIKEIPELNQLARQHDDIRVFGVNYDGATGDELGAQVETLGIEFPLLTADPAAELGTTRPAVLPTTLVITPDGELAATLIGPQTLESLLAAIDNTPEE